MFYKYTVYCLSIERFIKKKKKISAELSLDLKTLTNKMNAFTVILTFFQTNKMCNELNEFRKI